jgi:hypothetical protein
MNETRTTYHPSATTDVIVTRGATSDTTVTGNLYYSFKTDDTRSGQKLAGFRRRIANLENATTPFTGRKCVVRQINGSYYIRYDAAVGYRKFESLSGTHRIGGTFQAPEALSITEADNLAKRKVLQDVMERRSQFQGGVFLAEIRDTIRGIRQPLKAIRDGLTRYHHSAKKLKGKVARAEFQKALSGTWLEFQFGILQNVRDVDSALDNLRAMSKPRALHFKTNGKTVVNSKPPATFTFPSPHPIGASFTQVMDRRDTVIVIYRGAYKVMPPRGWDWKSWGVSTQDFLPSIWEAIPWSFAVDYFTNIGQIIQSYSYLDTDIAWVAKTVRNSVEYHQYGTNMVITGNGHNDPVIASGGSSADTRLAFISVTRSTATVAGLKPKLQLQVPGASSLRWLNIAALARLRTL